MEQRQLLGSLALLLFLIQSANAQVKEVQVLYDSLDQRIKEKYFVLQDNPQILEGNYESYFLNGNMKAKGQYKNNQAIGTWSYFFENGKLKMRAELEDGGKSGNWIYYFENGIISRQGRLENGKKQGLWEFFYESGQIKSKGYYLDDLRDGNWNIFYEDNALKAQAVYSGEEALYREFYPGGEKKVEGKIVDGKSDSTWVYYYRNGKLKAIGEEENGLKKGNWVYYYENGEKESEGTYENGQKNGPWKYYYIDGALNAEGELKEDKKEGFWKLYYNGGESLAEGTYKEGTGSYKEFYESGKVKVQGFVKEGVNDSTWTFFYEDGAVEGECDYEEGVGEYTGYHKNGNIKMVGTLKNGEKAGVWRLYDKKGKLAGTYRTYYDNEEPIIVEDPLALKNEEPRKPLESTKPSYKFKQKKRIRYFEPRINEYRSFILSANPLQTLFGSFPVSLEYYYQERLGYELKIAWIRDPFYVANKRVASDIPYQRGFFIDARQKFYFEKNIYGLLYFGHEIRYSRSNYGVNLSTPIPSFTASLNEDLIEYSIVLGDRLMESHANKGFTLDIWGGLGIGYRRVTKNWANIPAVTRAYQDVNEDPVSIPIRIGFTVGYVFKYNPSPLYN